MAEAMKETVANLLKGIDRFDIFIYIKNVKF